jgi:hypothetical protein
VGWNEVEPGFQLGKLRRHSTQEQILVFQCLSADNKKALQNFTNQYGPVSLTPDFETTIVGKKAALAMVNNDQTAYNCLDLQVRLNLDNQVEQNISQWVEQSMTLAKSLEQALS